MSFVFSQAPSQVPFQRFGLALPITTAFYQAADRFARQCPLTEKAVQIRRNTLAVCAVNAYLELLEIPTALAEGDSWNPMMQLMTDTADLVVPELGVLCCRAMEPDVDACYVPPEEWHDRMGYVAVVLDEEANEAQLIGFAAQVGEVESVPLDQFGPMEALVDEVHRLQAARVGRVDMATSTSTVRSTLTKLGQWAEGAVAASWQAMDTLVNPTEMSFAFRSAAELAGSQTTQDVSRAKLVDLGIQLGQSVRVALVVHMMQAEADHRSNIVLQVRPLGGSSYLPEGLTLFVLDDQDEVYRTAESRAIDNYIQLQLSGQAGELFAVQITLGDNTFKEQFVI